MSIHHFNIKIAEIYGISEAIILQNLSFWQAKNEANEKNFHDEKYWVYNSVKAFECLFPYWSKGQINRILKNLETAEALSVGNYNKVSYDRTKWYSLKQEIHLLITGNGIVINGKPIPDSKTDINKDILLEDLPVFVNDILWNDFKEMRKDEKKPLDTQRKIDGQIKLLTEFEGKYIGAANASLESAIDRCYTSVFFVRKEGLALAPAKFDPKTWTGR